MPADSLKGSAGRGTAGPAASAPGLLVEPPSSVPDSSAVIGLRSDEGITGDGSFFCLELFSGTAGLTRAVQQYLPDSFGIDHIIKQPKARVISLDLDDEHNQALVRGWIVSPQCFWVHFGIPCGTSSRARDRPLSDSHHGPRPFRSSQWPDGLPDLPERHLPRLRAANRLYAFMRDTLLALRGSPVLWTVENPWRSYLWDTTYWHAVHDAFEPHYVECHHCMFGGERRKATCFASNSPLILPMGVKCYDAHPHKPWLVREGHFDTALEAEYPTKLCLELARAMFGHRFPLKAPVRDSTLAAAGAQKQACRAAPPIVSEFAQVITVQSTEELPFAVDNHKCLATCITRSADGAIITLPCGSKVLRTAQFNLQPGEKTVTWAVSKGSDAAWTQDFNSAVGKEQLATAARLSRSPCGRCAAVSLDLAGGVAFEQCVSSRWVVGVRHTPEEFVKLAAQAGHPFHLETGVPHVLRDCMDAVATMSPADVASHKSRTSPCGCSGPRS